MSLSSEVILSSKLFLEVQDKFFKKIPNEALQSLPHFGILKSTSNGFLYVDIDDNYIHYLIRFIADQGFEKPPYFGSSELVGAHISVGYVEDQLIWDWGEIVPFAPVRCYRATPQNSVEMGEIFAIEIESFALKRIQERYGIKSGEIPFHITVGAKKISA